MQIAEIYYRARIDTAGLQQMGPGLAQMGRGVGQVTQGIDKLATRAAIAGVGLGGFVIKTAASFEQAEAGIRKTVEGTTGQVDAVITSLKEMSRVVPLSFEELAGIAAEGGALGIATDGLANFTDIVARLSVSTDLTAAAASTALGQLSNVLGLSDDDLRDFGDSLVALGNDGASTESQILDMAARFGAAGKQAGLSNEAILALSSTTASMGIEAEAGGGALSRVFNGITLDIGTATEESEVLADAMGLSLAELRTAWDQDAGTVFQELLGYLNDLDKFEQAEFLSNLGITNTRDINAISLLASGVEEYGRQLGVAEGQTNELNKESDAFFNTTEGKWEIFKNNVRLAADSFGSELLPVVNEVMGELTDRLNDPAVQAGIKRFAEDLAGGLRSFVKELKGTDFTPLLSGLRLAADTARLAFDAFRSLPGPIQQLALAALVTNKVSGGAVGSIAKGLANILGGTIKMAFPKLDFFTRGATPVNPLFVQMAGGLPGGDLLSPTSAAGRGFLSSVKSGLMAGMKYVGGPLAAVFAGWEIGQMLNEQTVAPARNFETAAVDSVLNSRDPQTIANAIDTLTKALNPDDGDPWNLTGEEIAIALDINGVRSTLEGQLAALKVVQDEVGTVATTARTAASSGEGGGSGSFTVPPSVGPNRVGDAVGADTVLLQNFGDKLEDLATKDVILALQRTAEVGLKDVGTSFQVGIKSGTDPIGAIATRILARAENPLDPPVMAEINGHIAGLEEIQAAYLVNGDVKLAAKVQTNIDTLNGLIGKTDEVRGVTQYMAEQAASSDAALLATAERQTTTIGSKVDQARAAASSDVAMLNSTGLNTQAAIHTFNASEGTRASAQQARVSEARDAIHTLNASEGNRFVTLGGTVNTLNANEGTRAASAMALMQADTAAVHTLNANEGMRAAATQSAVHTFNASEGNRFLTLGGKVDANQAAVHTLNASEGARFSNLGVRVDASSSKAAVHSLNASEGTRFFTLGSRVGAVEGAINRMHGTLAAKRFEAVVQQTQNYYNQTGSLGGTAGARTRGTAPVAYAEGSWSIPEDQLAYVHRGEMVVPSTPAEWMRRMGAGESGASNVTVNLQGLVKARSVREIGTELKRMADFGYFSAQQQPLLNRSVKMR